MLANDRGQFLKKMIKKLYSFSFIVIPDQMQISQVIIDSLNATFADKKFCEKFHLYPTSEELNFFEPRELEVIFFKSTYLILMKREKQLNEMIKISYLKMEEKISRNFFLLSFDEKIIIYLRDKYEFALKEIELISGKKTDEIREILFSARKKMDHFLQLNEIRI